MPTGSVNLFVAVAEDRGIMRRAVGDHERPEVEGVRYPTLVFLASERSRAKISLSEFPLQVSASRGFEICEPEARRLDLVRVVAIHCCALKYPETEDEIAEFNRCASDAVRAVCDVADAGGFVLQMIPKFPGKRSNSRSIRSLLARHGFRNAAGTGGKIMEYTPQSQPSRS